MLAVAQNLAMLFAARIVDGLSGGNITTARAYIADVTPEEDRPRAYGLLGAAFGLGFIIGPALGAAFSHISYTAPIWVAAAVTVAAIALAWRWLPETVHRAHAGGGSMWRAVAELSQRPGLRLLLSVDFLYWMSFAVYQTTFALFGARRFGFDASHTGYLLSAFGLLGVIVQGGLVAPVVRVLGTRRTLVTGLLFAAAGWGGSALTHSIPVFVAMLVPGAIGIGLCNATLSALVSTAAAPHEQGRVQGAAGGLESLGRAVGPVWGNGTLQVYGEGTAYGAAALILVGAAAMTARYHAPVSARAPVPAASPDRPAD
jgi:DHA1 family tetracycline resistance protein-like MFS transporter